MLKPSLQLRQSQQLTMTPQLQQAIRLLQLPILDLQTQIQEALDENVMLEVDETASLEAAEETAEGADDSAEADVSDADWTDIQRTGPSDTPISYQPRDQPEYADLSGDTLKDHLLWQLELEILDPRTTAIGQAIVDGINEDGYLTEEFEAIQATLAPNIVASPDEIEVALGVVQRLDPAGVGARSISECVLLQLQQLDPETPGLALAKTTAQEHLELVAEHQFATLKRQLNATDEELDDALVLVRACHPRPGSSIASSAAEYVIPDVYVRRSDGSWSVELNTTITPKLRVNQSYVGSLGRDGEYDLLRTQLQEARWLIRSLEIRDQTLLKVATTIVERQTEFLEHGEEHMRPMVLRDIAESIEMHESTVSRVTTNKYMHTPRGVFELRYFFSSHLTSKDGERSSTAVRAKIRKLIGGERPEKPLSDNQIAKILSAEGIHVARRTVAKYREGMGISSSSERKRSKLVS